MVRFKLVATLYKTAGFLILPWNDKICSCRELTNGIYVYLTNIKVIFIFDNDFRFTELFRNGDVNTCWCRNKPSKKNVGFIGLVYNYKPQTNAWNSLHNH